MSCALTTEPFQTQQSRLFKYFVCLSPLIYGLVLFFQNVQLLGYQILCLMYRVNLFTFLLIEIGLLSIRHYLDNEKNMEHRPIYKRKGFEVLKIDTIWRF